MMQTASRRHRVRGAFRDAFSIFHIHNYTHENHDEFQNIPNYQRENHVKLEERTIEKGLLNPIGDNSCFINSVIQALWHVTAFRSSFSFVEDHRHTIPSHRESCIFCCLKSIFAEYEFGHRKALPTHQLREAMSRVFSDQHRFELGKYADAVETFEEIVRLLHVAVSFKGREEKEAVLEEGECEPLCFVHKVFKLNVCEQQHCLKCEQRSEPLMINDIVYYVYAAVMRETVSKNNNIRIDQILREADNMDERTCTDEKCRGNCKLHHHLLSNPDVFCVGIVWDSPYCNREEISLVLGGINESLDLKIVFDSTEGENTKYQLKGMICYYGHHYDSYFYNKNEGCWYVFDDAEVKRVEEPGLEGVKRKCLMGKFQPSLLFYEKLNTKEDQVITNKVESNNGFSLENQSYLPADQQHRHEEIENQYIPHNLDPSYQQNQYINTASPPVSYYNPHLGINQWSQFTEVQPQSNGFNSDLSTPSYSNNPVPVNHYPPGGFAATIPTNIRRC